MSVVSGGKIIFCEGKKTSLDYRLLNKLVSDITGGRCTVVSVGGKFSFSTFIQGYFSSNDITNQRYIAFRDRDFDLQPTSSSQLLELVNKHGRVWAFATHRACIENYLIDKNLIHRYWSERFIEKQDNPSSRWGHGDSPGVETISQWIERSARNLQFYQSVRWALGDLSRRSSARAQLKTTWTGNSGSLPSALDLQSCQDRALELINQFKQANDSITMENFEEELNLHQQRFNQEDFWSQQQHLIWFHGKDLQKEMQRQTSKDINFISLSSFFDWAVTQLDVAQHPDLIELRAKIEQL